MARRRILSGSVVVVGLSIAIMVGAAPAAFANSFTHSYDDVTFGYNDGADSFCVEPKNGNDAHVRMAPQVAGGGPVYDVTVPDGSWKCLSLARAYEDTPYSYAVWTDVHSYPGTFYS
jgi:hypothetical protein